MTTAYHLRVKAQGEAWVRGESKHNNVDDECCPDFSCCTPGLFMQNAELRRQDFNRWAKQYGFDELKPQ